MLASEVMDLSASLLNDTDKDQWTHAVQLPYLKAAFDKLLSKLKNAGVPLLHEVSADITVTALATTVDTATSDIVQPKKLFEKAVGALDDQFIEMAEIAWEPTTVKNSYLRYWVWREGEIKLLGATETRVVRIQYLKNLTTPASASATITIPDSKMYLAYETAAICAGLSGGNFERAGILNSEAEAFADELLGIAAKAKQSLGYRRRPFRVR